LKFAYPHRNWRSPLTLSELAYRSDCDVPATYYIRVGLQWKVGDHTTLRWVTLRLFIYRWNCLENILNRTGDWDRV